MGTILLTIVTAVVIPLGLMVVQQSYKVKPKEWNAVLLDITFTPASACGAALLFRLSSNFQNEDSLTDAVGRLLTIGGGIWLVFFTIIGGLITKDDYDSLRQGAATPPPH
jgi:predicted permease